MAANDGVGGSGERKKKRKISGRIGKRGSAKAEGEEMRSREKAKAEVEGEEVRRREGVKTRPRSL